MKIVNSEDLPVGDIVAQLLEDRPLPMGRIEFDEWSDRIIAGALIPGGADCPQIFIEGQKFALANMLMHLGPTESHKPDMFFVKSLRKFAINQVADTVRKELHEAAKVRTAAEEAKKQAEVQAEDAARARSNVFDPDVHTRDAAGVV